MSNFKITVEQYPFDQLSSEAQAKLESRKESCLVGKIEMFFVSLDFEVAYSAPVEFENEGQVWFEPFSIDTVECKELDWFLAGPIFERVSPETFERLEDAARDHLEQENEAFAFECFDED
jgi:hypothetical protein